MSKRIVPILCLAALAVSGCGMTRAAQRPPEPIAVVQPVAPEILAPKKGSIWQSTNRNSLFQDAKARNVGDIVSASSELTNDHTAKGETNRESTFETSVSCVVTEVLPNGNLRIEGRRDITINHENQFIILSGIVRPEDISAGNAVESKKIADARIEYSGDGDLDDQQRPGWLNRLFSTIRIL